MSNLDDSMIELGYSIQRSPGIYALLLGSGISTGAGIPTAQQITDDLIGKLATGHDEFDIKKIERVVQGQIF